MTVLIIGNQWFWTYEYTEYGVKYDSYMVCEDLIVGDFRLLEVDKPMILPYHLWVRLLATSMDVIHS